MRHRPSSPRAYIIVGVNFFFNLEVWENKYRVKIENMKGKSPFGMEVRDVLPKITGREGANCKKDIVFWWTNCARVFEAENW